MGHLLLLPRQQHRLTPANRDYTVDTLSKPAAPQRGLFSKSSVNGLQHRQRRFSPDRRYGEPTRALNLLLYERFWRLFGSEPAGTDSGCTGQLKTFRGPILGFSQDDDRLGAKSTFRGWRRPLNGHGGVHFFRCPEGKVLSFNYHSASPEQGGGELKPLRHHGKVTTWTVPMTTSLHSKQNNSLNISNSRVYTTDTTWG